MKIIYPSILIFLVFFSCQKKGNQIKPQTKPLMEAVYASGFVVSQNEYQVYSQVDGYLSEKLVNDGQEIKKGDPLFIIEADQQSARYRIAKETYELASRNYQDGSPVMNELKAARETAKTKMQFDSINFVRYTNLLKQNATSTADFDRMKLLYENSKNDFSLQKSRYEKTRNQLYLELQNAKNQLQIAGDESGRYTVRSDADGMVFKTMKEKGELIRRNEAIAVVGNEGAFYLQLSVDELDIQRIKEGQEVLVKIDAYSNKVFHAQVSKVYSMINPQQQSLRVDAMFNEKLPGEFSGLAVEANIVIRQKNDALVIPKTALLPGDSIMIKTEDGEKKISVVKGIETLDEVEIVEGLDTGKLIVIR